VARIEFGICITTFSVITLPVLSDTARRMNSIGLTYLLVSRK